MLKIDGAKENDPTKVHNKLVCNLKSTILNNFQYDNISNSTCFHSLLFLLTNSSSNKIPYLQIWANY